jgi:hypothetical protein
VLKPGTTSVLRPGLLSAVPSGLSRFYADTVGRLTQAEAVPNSVQGEGERHPLPLVKLTYSFEQRPISATIALALSRRGVTPTSAEHFVDCGNEVVCRRTSGDRATQDGLVGNVFAVIDFCIRRVLVNFVAG